jgi:hypothetical protein
MSSIILHIIAGISSFWALFTMEFTLYWTVRGIAISHDCHECLLVQFSTKRQYSGDSYFREQDFYSNKFTWHFPMDPNACLYYSSQPRLTQTFTQVSLTMRHLLSWWVDISVPRGSAWVYIPCGDLTTSVICTVTLELAY